MQVHTLRVEVQRLQVKIQEAEARASASQRIAEEAQRELQAVVAASNSPVAPQARQAMEAEKAILRQQLGVHISSLLASVNPAHRAPYGMMFATLQARLPRHAFGLPEHTLGSPGQVLVLSSVAVTGHEPRPPSNLKVISQTC